MQAFLLKTNKQKNNYSEELFLPHLLYEERMKCPRETQFWKSKACLYIQEILPTNT